MYFTDFKSGWILSLDPGTEKTGIVHSFNGRINFADSNMPNERVLEFLENMKTGIVAMEKLVSYKMKVGQTTFDTIFWTGRFFQAATRPVVKLSRRAVSSFMLAKGDKGIRRAVLSLYESSGGGTTPQIGTKAKPGPLYGVHSHAIQALAVGIAAYGKKMNLRNIRGFQQQTIFKMPENTRNTVL